MTTAESVGRHDGLGPLAAPGLGRRLLPFGIAYVLSIATLALPATQISHPRALILAVVAAAALVLICWLTPWDRLPTTLQASVPLGSLVVVAFLRHATQGSTSPFTALIILAVVWLALYGSRGQVAASIVVGTAALLAPVPIFGPPDYPDGALTRGLLWPVTAAIIGGAVHSLVSSQRARTDELMQLRDEQHWLVEALARRADELAREREATRATRDLFVGVVNAVTEQAIIATDPDGLVTVFNRGAERMLGYRADDVVGQLTPLAWHDADEVAGRAAERGISGSFEVLVATAREGTPETRVWTYRTRRDQRIDVSLSVTAMHAADGSITGFIGVATDVTRQRAAERLKDEFVSQVSHELRTPLTSVVGYVELLLDDDVSDEAQRRRYLEVVNRNARRLLRLVGDLLLTSQADAGRLGITMEPADLGALAGGATDAARQRAEQKGVQLELDVAAPTPVHVDSGRLDQVLDNLIGNAIKFTPTGGSVRVAVRPVGDRAELEVSDTGIGIPMEEQRHLFERFFRSSTATRRSIPGVGLGLSIVKAIVDAHGGDLTVQSEQEKGTTMRVSLPAAAD